LALAAGPEIFNSVTGIEDDKYYTKESLELCKEGITNLSVISTAISSASLSALREVSSCGKPYSTVPATPDSTSTYVVKGNECKLEEVSFIGL
jgi:small lipoprotein (TIGR04452 family)